MSRILPLLILVAAIVVAFISGFLFKGSLSLSINPSNEVSVNKSPLADGEYFVTRVLDGDTIDLENGSRIRYAGIDAPEKHESYGITSYEHNLALVANRQIRIEVDDEGLDEFGRTLAYVWSGDIFVNERLIEDGYAKVFIYRKTKIYKYSAELTSAEMRARNAKRGMWVWEGTK